MWQEILGNPEGLARAYARIWRAQIGREREYYDAVRAKFNRTHRPVYFLYLLARCVKAAIRYNGEGEFNTSPDNRRKGARPHTMRERIVNASALLAGRTELSCRDYAEVLDRCGRSDLIYMDPPYQGVCGNRDHRYCPKVDHVRFCAALSALNEKGAMYLVSYDGRTGDKSYGPPLPAYLRLKRVEVHAGRSSQATLLGREHQTYESLYLSAALVEAISCAKRARRRPGQLEFAW